MSTACIIAPTLPAILVPVGNPAQVCWSGLPSEHGIDLKRSFVVGDRHNDIALAHRAGSRGILVRTGYGEGELLWHASKWTSQPDFVAADLSGAVDWILEQPA